MSRVFALTDEMSHAAEGGRTRGIYAESALSVTSLVGLNIAPAARMRAKHMPYSCRAMDRWWPCCVKR